MTPLTLTPDVEKIVTDALRAHADIVALNTRIRVTSPPKDERATSWVKVTKLDAPQVNQPDHLVSFMVQCDCYAGATGGVPEVSTLERTVRAVLGTLPGVHTTGTVTGVQVLGGPRGLGSDMEPARDRAILTVIIHAHA